MPSNPPAATPTETIIMGIDPGTNVMGYGFLKVLGKKASLVALGVIDLRPYRDTYIKLGRIYERVTGLIDSYHPDELAIEAPFFGKNAQSMLKLGRAQGVAISAAINRDIPIHEYAPLKIKMSITGNGRASKEQVAAMLKQILKIKDDLKVPFLDATDALGAAYCHYLERTKPVTGRHAGSWAGFIRQHPDRVQGIDITKQDKNAKTHHDN